MIYRKMQNQKLGIFELSLLLYKKPLLLQIKVMDFLLQYESYAFAYLQNEIS
jgi:hypothetical protein